jgi:Fe-S-cluster containining protein
MVVISGYASTLYNTALRGWERIPIPMPNHAGQTKVTGDRVEIVWLNPGHDKFELRGCRPVWAEKASSMNLPVLNCDDCGACCQYMGAVPTAMLDRDGFTPIPGCKPLPEWLKAELRADWEWVNRTGRSDFEPCIWFDQETRRCKHYEYRPEVCRDFEVGEEACLRWRFTELGIEPPSGDENLVEKWQAEWEAQEAFQAKLDAAPDQETRERVFREHIAQIQAKLDAASD